MKIQQITVQNSEKNKFNSTKKKKRNSQRQKNAYQFKTQKIPPLWQNEGLAIAIGIYSIEDAKSRQQQRFKFLEF